MESANETKSTTLGLLENLKVTFGTIDIYLQVQVVEKAPFDVLLGRPFFAHTSCKTQDYRNGDQHITIRDPNSDQTLTLPTRPRTLVRRKSPRESSPSGF